jgi:hypothetical protein
MMNIPPAQYLPSAPSGNTVQVMNTVTVANNAAAQFGSLSDIMGQALTNDLLENFTRINNEGKGIKISLKDIKGDARYLSKLTPAMAVAAGLTITDDYGNVVIGAAPQQQQMMMAPQQQQMMMAPQQQSPQQMNQQQQFAVTMMQELKKMQAQINQPAPAPALTKTSFSQNSSPVNSWASVSNDPSDYWNPSQDTTSSTSSPSQNSSDDGVLDFWGNPSSSRSTASSSSSSPNPFFEVGVSSSPPQNKNTSQSNASLQAQMNQMIQMMQMMQMMLQGTMPQQQTMMPQQQMMYAPQPQMTLMDFKAMQAGTQMVVNAPQQRAPQQSALTQRVMENFQNSSSDSMSF